MAPASTPAPSAAAPPARPPSASPTPSIRAYTEVAQAVRDAGLLRRTPWFYALVAAAIAIGYAACGIALVLLGDSWLQLLVAGVLGILLTQTAFLAHEAAHRQILGRGPANDRLAQVLGAIAGMSYSWWDSKHSRHHANPNRVGRDPDIDVDTISFLEEDAAASTGLRRLVTGRQGWLFFPLLTLEGVNLHFLGLRHLLSREPVKDRWIELASLATRFAIFPTAVFLILPLGLALAFTGVQLAVFGLYMGASFAPNHKGMPVVRRDSKLDFFSKQVLTSRNVSGGWWATVLMGGLNYQVEHHLFPSMPRPGLAKARKIVMAHCRATGVPYTEATLLRSYGIVIAYLNEVGLAARDPFECPFLNEYRRL
ncbi:acyl-CoA desaturase [Glycomyces artemisiae]|uniref:fatty acid desaturase family protein n=1 Tax=Glycomyces artemisiae TaxID=1076443 RepID=UPI000D075E50